MGIDWIEGNRVVGCRGSFATVRPLTVESLEKKLQGFRDGTESFLVSLLNVNSSKCLAPTGKMTEAAPVEHATGRRRSFELAAGADAEACNRYLGVFVRVQQGADARKGKLFRG